MVLIIAWAAVGWLSGIGLEWLALATAGDRTPRCPVCGGAEPGPRLSALLRALGEAGGRCQICGSRAIWWLAALGPSLALLFALLAALHLTAPVLLTTSLYTALLALVAVQDLRQRLVYPGVVYPATVVAAVLTPLALREPLWAGLAGALVGAGVFFALHLLARLLYQGGEALGFGDVMIAGLVGAMAGFPAVASALALGALLGGLAAAVIGLVQRSRRAAFAYGPALCLGGLLTLLTRLPS